MLPKKKEKGPSYTEPTPEWSEASWWNERLCHRRGERWEAPEARVLPWEWLSINPKEKKQHVKIWVKRYPKDTGVPVPHECHDWGKLPSCWCTNREPPAEGGDTGGDKSAEAAAASSTGQVAVEGSGQAAPTTKDVELGDADFSVDAAIEVDDSQETEGGVPSKGGAPLPKKWWRLEERHCGRLGVHPAGVARQPGGASGATAVLGGQCLVCASVYGPLACTRHLHQS